MVQVIVDCAGTGTGGWQKIDNSSVLSGVGTGQTVALWQGASSVTDSETLGNAPITVSGNDTTFAGDVTVGTGIIKASIGGDIAITQGAIGLRINDTASAISPTTASANNDNAVDLGVSNIRFRNLYMGGNGTFAGDVNALGFNMNLDYAASNEYLVIAKAQAQDGGIVLKSKPTSGNAQNDWQILNHSTTGDLRFYAYGLGGFALTLDREDGNATFAGNVKIGSSTTGTPAANASDLVIDKGASESGITIISTTASSLRFGDAANTSIGSIEYNHNSDYMRMIVNNAERMRIDSSGNVGIGTGSPTNYYSGADNLVVSQASGEGGISIVTATNTTGALYFADGVSGSEQYRGGIFYTHSNDSLGLVSGGSTKVTLDTNGNLGIGTTSPSAFNQRVNAPHLVVGAGNNSAGLTLYSGVASQGSINFADGTTTTDQYTGGILYVHGSDNYMTFYTNGGVEKMRIGSNGAIKFNSYDSTNQTGTPTYLLGTDASGNVVKTLSTPSPITSQAASLYDLIPNGEHLQLLTRLLLQLERMLR
jgi:hypothetical protein